MKKLLGILTVVILITNISCKDERKEAVKASNAQMKKVMAIHDEVMPKMSLMGSMVGELSSKEDSTTIGLQYKAARIELQDAHKAMMDWMQGFGNRFDSDEILNGKELTEQKQIWLDEEEEKVKALREQIYSSIENAEKILGLNNALKTSYLKIKGVEGSGYRLDGGKPIMTEKASVVEKLRGAITIMEDLTMINKDKVLYFQFLGPDMGVIEDNANTIIVQGNVYSKRIPVSFMGVEQIVLAAITVPAGSLKPGKYTFNVFEDQRLLDSAEFQLK